MTDLLPGAWNARLLSLFELGPDAIVNLPAPQPTQSVELSRHPLGALLQTLSPSAACVSTQAAPCATIAFANQRSIWLRTPSIWHHIETETNGQQWLAWGTYAATLRGRCQAAGWHKIAWLVGISLTPELAKVARYSLLPDPPPQTTEWLVTATHIHTLLPS